MVFGKNEVRVLATGMLQYEEDDEGVAVALPLVDCGADVEMDEGGTVA